MDDPDLANDIRYLREVVAKTQPRTANRYWPITVAWGCVVTTGYLACILLARAGRFAALPWVWPALIFLVGIPLHWYLQRRVRMNIEATGVRPRFRKDLLWCWVAITAMGFLWTAGMIYTNAGHWYLISFIWSTLYIVGYVMNGVLLSKEWFWAAGTLLVAVVAGFLAGPDYYWLPGLGIGVTFLLAGVLGRRNQSAAA